MDNSIMIDRTQAPSLQNLGDITVTQAEKGFLDNNIPFYTLPSGEQEVIKFEIIFPSGTVYEPGKAVAVTTCNLLDEGTDKYTSKKIAEKFEYYGASIEKHTTFDYSSVVLYSLNKHLDKTLPLLFEIISNASFPEKELQTYIERRKQKLKINNERVEYIARKEFMKQLFGTSHPYGYETKSEHYNSLNTNQLKKYHSKAFALDNSKIIASGKIGDTEIKLINKYFGQSTALSNIEKLEKNNTVLNLTNGNINNHIKKEGAVQCGIRIGKVLFNKTHQDYFELSVLNTILGGYFGSRLMSNIREDKGYTYGIGSGLVSHLESGYFFISTQVGVEVCRDAVREIYKEIDILKNEMVTDEELDLVKKYMQGAFVRSIDGPFALANAFKGLLLYDLDYSFLKNYLSVIQSVTPDKLNQLARKYFDNFSETVVGLN